MQIANVESVTKRRIGRPRNSSGDNAETMLRVALDLFSAQNYSSVSIKDIAKATRVNASLVHYYFSSKEELFLKVVESTANEAFRTFEALRNNTVSPREVLSLWIENHMLQFELMQKLMKISLDYASTHDRAPRIDEAIRKIYVIEADVLGRALERGMAEGDFRLRNIDETITFISTFIDGALVRSVMFPTQFDPRAAIRNLRDVVLAYLQAE